MREVPSCFPIWLTGTVYPAIAFVQLAVNPIASYGLSYEIPFSLSTIGSFYVSSAVTVSFCSSGNLGST